MEVKTEDPLTSGRNATAGRGSNDLILNYIYFLSILYFCNDKIPFNVFLPIKFRNNSINKCNICYVVENLHWRNLLLIICIRLLDFPIFVNGGTLMCLKR